ncbi:MAG: four helix bundle protein [Candidatus Cloacimonetes bacterium]|nr:four helix bundle protein [Candidatus Cloacimonadota bacterium]
MKKENPIFDRSVEFALDIIELHKYLVDSKKEYVMSKQLLRSATSIGANLKEAELSISKREFIAKVQISLKEAGETEYWLELLERSGYIQNDNKLKQEAISIQNILTAIIKKAKANLNEKH